MNKIHAANSFHDEDLFDEEDWISENISRFNNILHLLHHDVLKFISKQGKLKKIFYIYEWWLIYLTTNTTAEIVIIYCCVAITTYSLSTTQY